MSARPKCGRRSSGHCGKGERAPLALPQPKTLRNTRKLLRSAQVSHRLSQGSYTAGKGDSLMSRAQTIAIKASPAGWFRLLIVLGLIAALVIAAVVAVIETIDVSRRCEGGAFSSGFSAGFQTRRCEIIIRLVRVGVEAMIPLC